MPFHAASPRPTSRDHAPSTPSPSTFQPRSYDQVKSRISLPSLDFVRGSTFVFRLDRSAVSWLCSTNVDLNSFDELLIPRDWRGISHERVFAVLVQHGTKLPSQVPVSRFVRAPRANGANGANEVNGANGPNGPSEAWKSAVSIGTVRDSSELWVSIERDENDHRDDQEAPYVRTTAFYPPFRHLALPPTSYLLSLRPFRGTNDRLISAVRETIRVGRHRVARARVVSRTAYLRLPSPEPSIRC